MIRIGKTTIVGMGTKTASMPNGVSRTTAMAIGNSENFHQMKGTNIGGGAMTSTKGGPSRPGPAPPIQEPAPSIHEPAPPPQPIEEPDYPLDPGPAVDPERHPVDDLG